MTGHLLRPFAAAAALLTMACGSAQGSLLPEPEPCATPATPTRPAGTSANRAYLNAIAEAETRLKRPGYDFLQRWPSRKFSRQDNFRTELAIAADRTICAAEEMRALAPPDGRYAAYDAHLDDTLAAFAVRMRLGREAAETRNVSKYRDWLAALDGLPASLEAAHQHLPPR